MKTFLKPFTLMILAVLAMATFSACSEEDGNDNKVYFTLGFDEYSFSGSSADNAEVSSYMSQVEDAYYKALGMSSSNNTVILTGDYKTLKEQMKNKFNSVQLPSAPSISGSYSFVIALYSQDLSSDSNKQDLVASKTFSN